VVAVVVGRALASGVAAAEPRFDRAVAEPQLAPAAEGWGWFESESGGFVRDADGGAFAVSRAADPGLPAELGAALRQAARAGTAPERVVVHRPADERLLAAWTRAGGAPFVAGAPWQWTSAAPAAFDAAVDVLPSARPAHSPSSPRGRSLTATAIGLFALAGALHLGATAGTWVWNKFQVARSERELASIARELGGTVAADIARLHGEARHRAGQSAPHDAMPLLARAAPALAALPPGVLRSAAYAQGAWTIELARLDDATLSALRERAAGAGLSVVHAATQSGVRARIGVAP
jgi:hypothetical protein